MKIVYTSIVGDLFHVGHLNLLIRAKEMGDYLIVGVLTDEAVEAYKRTPIIPFEHRIKIIKNIKCVDQVVLQSERDGTENLRKFKPDILTRGDDSVLEKEVAYIQSIGGEFVLLPQTKGISTTNLIEKIRRENE